MTRGNAMILMRPLIFNIPILLTLDILNKINKKLKVNWINLYNNLKIRIKNKLLNH